MFGFLSNGLVYLREREVGNRHLKEICLHACTCTCFVTDATRQLASRERSEGKREKQYVCIGERGEKGGGLMQ